VIPEAGIAGEVKDATGAVLPGVTVEAASPLGWDRFVGDQGAIIGMNTFGASAPAKDVFEYFGFTPENVAAKAREVRERVQA